MVFTIYRGTRTNGNDKIGCDEDYPNRPIQQDLTNYYIVEEHTDEMVASRRERELQIENNLPVDRFPYHLRKVRGSRGGVTRSNQESFKTLSKNTWDNHTVEERKARLIKFRENSHQGYSIAACKSGGSKGGATNAKKISTCQYCGKTGKHLSLIKFHFERCKDKA
tara:strand:- start:52 stop:549 length:498 start_codon:yes stop_codon:yes gene_type:complete